MEKMGSKNKDTEQDIFEMEKEFWITKYPDLSHSGLTKSEAGAVIWARSVVNLLQRRAQEIYDQYEDPETPECRGKVLGLILMMNDWDDLANASSDPNDYTYIKSLMFMYDQDIQNVAQLQEDRSRELSLGNDDPLFSQVSEIMRIGNFSKEDINTLLGEAKE
jgi:hypothetical protein